MSLEVIRRYFLQINEWQWVIISRKGENEKVTKKLLLAERVLCTTSNKECKVSVKWLRMEDSLNIEHFLSVSLLHL